MFDENCKVAVVLYKAVPCDCNSERMHFTTKAVLVLFTLTFVIVHIRNRRQISKKCSTSEIPTSSTSCQESVLRQRVKSCPYLTAWQDFHTQNYNKTMSPDGKASRRLFRVLMQAEEGICYQTMLLGGIWKSYGYEKQSGVCIDDFIKDKKECIVYSFDMVNEGTFEQDMMSIGCMVYAYGNVTRQVEKSLRQNDSTMRRGSIALTRINSQDAIDYATELSLHGHVNSIITYLKVSYRVGSVNVNQDTWLREEFLKNIVQISIQLDDVTKSKNLRRYVDMVKLLYKQGFRIFSYQPCFDVKHEIGTMITCSQVALIRRKSVCSG